MLAWLRRLLDKRKKNNVRPRMETALITNPTLHMDSPSVRIECPGKAFGTTITVDGVALTNVRAITVKIEVGKVPTVECEMFILPWRAGMKQEKICDVDGA